MNILKRVKYLYHFIKGKHYLIKEDALRGFLEFNLAQKYQFNEDFELYIYKGLSEFLLKKFENSIMSFQYALKLVENSKKLNIDEKNYLKKYIIDNILDLLKILENSENIKRYSKIYKELDFNVKNIRKRFFYDFPLNIQNYK